MPELVQAERAPGGVCLVRTPRRRFSALPLRRIILAVYRWVNPGGLVDGVCEMMDHFLRALLKE